MNGKKSSPQGPIPASLINASGKNITKPKTESEVRKLLQDLPGWQYENGEIHRTFTFKNYSETVPFVNAVVWVAINQDHHPEIEFGYKVCRIRYSTHSIGGLSDNDFICAAKINRLLS